DFVLGASILFRSVTAEAQGIGRGIFDRHRLMARAMRVMAIAALEPTVVHGALQKRVALNAILVGGAVVPELRCLFAFFRHESLPELRQLLARFISNSPSVFRPWGLAGLMARETNIHRAFDTQARRIHDVLYRRLSGMRLAGAVTAFTGDVQLGPTLL